VGTIEERYKGLPEQAALIARAYERTDEEYMAGLAGMLALAERLSEGMAEIIEEHPSVAEYWKDGQYNVSSLAHRLEDEIRIHNAEQEQGE
jgi:hypothetical protein